MLTAGVVLVVGYYEWIWAMLLHFEDVDKKNALKMWVVADLR